MSIFEKFRDRTSEEGTKTCADHGVGDLYCRDDYYYTSRVKEFTFDGAKVNLCNQHAIDRTVKELKALQPEPNKALMLESLANILQFPETWQQSTWRCGTSACFAGQAVLLAGFKWADQSPNSCSDLVKLPNGVQIGASQVGQAVLGLNNREASALFDGGNGLEDLGRVINKIIAGGYSDESDPIRF